MPNLTLRGGKLETRIGPQRGVLALYDRRTADGWHPLPLRASGDGFVAAAGGVTARLQLAGRDGRYSYALEFTAASPTRLTLLLEAPAAKAPFHLVPGIFFGDNNAAHSLGFGQVLSAAHPDAKLCSPSWEVRADCAYAPVSMLFAGGALLAASIDPYTETPVVEGDPREKFVRNALFVRVKHAGLPDACGVGLGHATLPAVPDRTSRQLAAHGRAGGRLWFLPAPSRLVAHTVIREEYEHRRDCPHPPISVADAITALLEAFQQVNWFDATGHNGLGTEAPQLTPFFGGHFVRNSFTNLRCEDQEKKLLKPWRTLAEIGWTGGATIAGPILAAGLRLKDKTAVARAQLLLDRVADGYNPFSGLLWDVAGGVEGRRLNWWYSGYMVWDVHCAYTNGSACWHLLKAWQDTPRTQRHDAWRDTACRVLETMLKLQRSDGNFGYAYAPDRPAIVDPDGFAGVWFAAALARAHEITGRKDYLRAARRAMEYYHARTVTLDGSWGTPMDQHKWPDQEGNLGFIRAAARLHRITRDPRYLTMLRDGAGYEYLWRYALNTRPQSPPLNHPRWNACGGSGTGIPGGFIHPMGLFINADLHYLAAQTGDDYHARRAEDGINWGVNTVSLYPEITRYGIRGVMTECWMASFPRPNVLNADGSPSTIWHSYNGWAAAATLEGLLEISRPAPRR